MRLLLAVGLLALASTSQAGIIHSYSFTAAGANGSFTYDDGGMSSVRVLGKGFESFEFTWDAITYSAADVIFGSIWLDANGRIDQSQTSTFFGNNCMPGSCNVMGGSNDWNIEILGFDLAGFGNDIFRYADGQVQAGQVGFTYNGTVSVPEPGSLALFSIGLLTLLRMRHRTAPEPSHC